MECDLSENLGYLYVHERDEKGEDYVRVGMLADSGSDVFCEDGVMPVEKFIFMK